ncbi:helicase-associated domain-containing protein [Paenibacillus caseinilyticus]|uniref:Helicase XPB/Ssl2 N-terminal domain-containing protein n=1 Tax=Paenibacillus mucilaginosus K02 TaxID=997761 RepID=I0BPP9_9BACL|nr:helicase-associated domain-containing protein [Paenibacillus mucilaginosus]AFH64346.1 hypothetical protein B2K_27250 [Paenibacillus mucilaginosus K02]
MKVAELAARMPRELRARMERETVYAPWLRRGMTLEELWTDKVVMETVYNRLGAAEREVLHAVVRWAACEPFDAGALERALPGHLSGAEARAGLAGLLRRGLLFAFRKTWGEHTYLLPSDGFAMWQDVLFPGLPEGLGQGALFADADGLGGSGVGLGGELFGVLAAAAQQGLKLTKHGTLHKKQIAKLAEGIRFEPGRLAGAGLKYAYGDTYPLELAVLLDLALRLGLLVQGDEELILRTEGLQSWLALPGAEQDRVLYGLWQGLALPGGAPLQHAVRLLEKLPEGVWFPAEAVISVLQDNGLAGGGESAAELAERLRGQWVAPLTAFGWLEEGRTPAGLTVYRWTAQPWEGGGEAMPDTEEGQFMVQPDFDILVPPDVSQAVRWELACLSDLASADHVSLYKLSRQSVRRALEHGRTADEICSFLRAHAMYGLPENVEHTLQQWAKPFGRTRFVQAVLLRCADEETAEAVAKLPGAERYLVESSGAKDFIVEAGELKGFSALLEKAGFMAGLPQGSGEEKQRRYPKLEPASAQDARSVWASLEAAGSDKGMIYSRHSVACFQMEGSVPETADLYPRLGEIPAGWLRDYRTYHSSTRREMVEKAIELKTSLQLRLKGTDVKLVPRKMQETRGTWSVTGYGTEPGEGAADGSRVSEEIRLLEGEWQEMKLILPGINDKF